MAACLAVLTGNGNATTAVDRYLALGGTASQVVFRTRLGLAVLDLTDEQSGLRLVAAIEADVRRSQDACAAREVLARPGAVSLIPAPAIGSLTRLADTSGMGARILPAGLLEQFTTTMTKAEDSLARALSRRPRPQYLSGPQGG